ncbi:MAG TPA: polysaccharide biosynthesis/export family protein, partial [Terriglobales bacterium]|nr:polysaccharide biosynthesis/export family protein [Terriglobales bacterium]
MNASWIRSVRWQTIVALAITLAFCATAANPQAATPAQQGRSELAQQNSSLVAASAAQIKTVLVQDAGLMVAVKQLVADDATAAGQIVDESDLSEEAIFDRLESDAGFRSSVTRLVQQYGYLLPKVNPESLLGKQQELVMQERAKWIAQQEEEERTQQRQQQLASSQTSSSCAQQSAANCRQQLPQAQLGNTPVGSRNMQPVSNPGAPMPSVTPQQPNTTAPGTPNSRLQQTLLTQMDGQTDPGLAMLGLSLPTTSPQLTGLSLTPQIDGAPGADGVDGNGSLPTKYSGASSLNLFSNGGAEEQGNPSPELDTIAPAHPYGSPVVPNQVSEQRSSQIVSQQQSPQLVRANNPYRDIPSLYDMYLQATPQPVGLKRFGSEVFENGTRDPQLIPMDMPAGPDYVVGPGDGLSIDLWGGVSQRLARTVDREGRVSLPEVGPLLVSGKSLADVQEELQTALRTQFKDESADVSLSRLRTIRIYEVGDVAVPGAYDISSLSTPLNALFAAGGPTPQGSLRLVK